METKNVILRPSNPTNPKAENLNRKDDEILDVKS